MTAIILELISGIPHAHEGKRLHEPIKYNETRLERENDERIMDVTKHEQLRKICRVSGEICRADTRL